VWREARDEDPAEGVRRPEGAEARRGCWRAEEPARAGGGEARVGARRTSVGSVGSRGSYCEAPRAPCSRPTRCPGSSCSHPDSVLFTLAGRAEPFFGGEDLLFMHRDEY
jgi:hypothetical protein